ncbi:MAG: DMP19 family protein, partial [Planctomycetota bacterium]
IVERLAVLGNEEPARYFESLTRSDDPDTRAFALRNAAMVARESDTTRVEQALSDPDHDVQSAVLDGLSHAAAREDPTHPFLETMFTALMPFAAGEQSTQLDGSAECMGEIDAPRATAILSTPRFIRRDNPNIKDVLATLHKLDFTPDPALLWPLLEQARSDLPGYRAERTHGLLLELAARTPSERVEREIEDALRSSLEGVRSGAASALLRLHQLPEPVDLLLIGDSERSDVEQYVASVSSLEGQVNNGGFLQYFFNSTGDDCLVALEATRAVGLPHTNSQLQRAVAVLGAHEPLADRDRRLELIADMRDADEEALESITSEFFADHDQLVVTLARYMVHHAAAIR